MSIYIFGSGGGGGTSGTDTSNDSVKANYVLAPHTFHDNKGNAGTGLIYEWGGSILAGASTDGNKMTIQPSQSTRHIAAGSYINREIELAAMPAGSVALSQSGNKVTATRTAGYVSAGSQDFTIGAGSTSLSRSGDTVTLTRQAGYINAGTDQLIVPLVSTSYNVTSNGTFSVPIPEGFAGLSALTIYANVQGSTPALQNRSVTIKQNTTTTYYATGTYDGMYSITVTTAVPATTPTTGAGTVFNGGSTLDISCPSGRTLYMAGFMASSAGYVNTSKVVGGYVRLGSSTGRGSYITSNGDPAVGDLTASFDGNTVTITPLSGYSFSGMSYKAFVCYV